VKIESESCGGKITPDPDWQDQGGKKGTGKKALFYRIFRKSRIFTANTITGATSTTHSIFRLDQNLVKCRITITSAAA
jgi:hypothetical protein